MNNKWVRRLVVLCAIVGILWTAAKIVTKAVRPVSFSCSVSYKNTYDIKVTNRGSRPITITGWSIIVKHGGVQVGSLTQGSGGEEVEIGGPSLPQRLPGNKYWTQVGLNVPDGTSAPGDRCQVLAPKYSKD